MTLLISFTLWIVLLLKIQNFIYISEIEIFYYFTEPGVFYAFKNVNNNKNNISPASGISRREFFKNEEL